jgi:hypothetical protein
VRSCGYGAFITAADSAPCALPAGLLRSLIHASLDMAQRVLSPLLTIFNLFDFLDNKETRRKRELEHIHYKMVHSGGV